MTESEGHREMDRKTGPERDAWRAARRSGQTSSGRRVRAQKQDNNRVWVGVCKIVSVCL